MRGTYRQSSLPLWRCFESIQQDSKSGEYTVGLPVLKEQDIRDVPRNEEVSYLRTVQALKKFVDKPDLFEKLQKVFDDHLQRGFIEKAVETGEHLPTSYMPWHPVFKESSVFTKVRVAFDFRLV